MSTKVNRLRSVINEVEDTNEPSMIGKGNTINPNYPKKQNLQGFVNTLESGVRLKDVEWSDNVSQVSMIVNADDESKIKELAEERGVNVKSTDEAQEEGEVKVTVTIDGNEDIAKDLLDTVNKAVEIPAEVGEDGGVADLGPVPVKNLDVVEIPDDLKPVKSSPMNKGLMGESKIQEDERGDMVYDRIDGLISIRLIGDFERVVKDIAEDLEPEGFEIEDIALYLERKLKEILYV